MFAVTSSINRVKAVSGLVDFLDDQPQGFHVDVAGTVKFKMKGSATWLTLTFAAGDWAYKVQAIDTTGGTATGIYALYQ